MTKRCPRCYEKFEGDEEVCPHDGAPLADLPTGSPVADASDRPSQPTPAYSDKPTLSGGVLDGRYEITRRLGEGGMSYVYQGRDLESGDVVAVKILSPSLVREAIPAQRLRREAQLAMQLEHPHICSIRRMGELENGLLYLVMPYLPGELLADRLEREGALPLRTGIEFLVQVCAALHHAHQLNIIHRDLKPENVMIVQNEAGREDASGLDFGLAKSVEVTGSSIDVTASGMIPGTPEFMSPEQVRSEPLDARSDIYALGVLGCELFTGQLPFEGRTTQQIMVSRLETRPRPVREMRSDLPGALEAVLLKALEVNPKDRYQTTLEFGLALAEAVDASEAPRSVALLR